MIVERTNKEILVRLSLDTDISELQNIIDFLEYKENTSKSKATQDDIDNLSSEVNASIWNRFNKKRKKS